MSLFMRGAEYPTTIPALLANRSSPTQLTEWVQRPYTLCQLYSRQRPHRVAAWRELSKWTDSAATLSGRHRDTTDIFDEATTLLKQCRFVLSMEGHMAPGYVTEKLVNALFAGAIPLYWGDDSAASLFNPKAFIRMREFENVSAVGRYMSALGTLRVSGYLEQPIATADSAKRLLWWRQQR